MLKGTPSDQYNRQFQIRCARIDSSWPKAYYRIGMALRSLQQYQSSREAFQTGIFLYIFMTKLNDMNRIESS